MSSRKDESAWVKMFRVGAGHEPVLGDSELEKRLGVNPLPLFRYVLAVAAASLAGLARGLQSAAENSQPRMGTRITSIARDEQG